MSMSYPRSRALGRAFIDDYDAGRGEAYTRRTRAILAHALREHRAAGDHGLARDCRGWALWMGYPVLLQEERRPNPERN